MSGLWVCGGSEELHHRRQDSAQLPQRRHHPTAAYGQTGGWWDADMTKTFFQSITFILVAEAAPWWLWIITFFVVCTVVFFCNLCSFCCFCFMSICICVHVCMCLYMCGCSGKHYGCIVRKKVMLLEELKRDTPEFGGFSLDSSTAAVCVCMCVCATLCVQLCVSQMLLVFCTLVCFLWHSIHFCNFQSCKSRITVSLFNLFSLFCYLTFPFVVKTHLL